MWTEDSRAVKPASIPPDFAALARLARGAVVSITATAKGASSDEPPSAKEFFEHYYGGAESPTKGLASGFVIRSDGYILTNEHVVEDASGLAVSIAGDDDRTYPATVVGRDDPSDLALVKIDAGRPLPVLALADSNGLGVGEWVAAIGNPFGLSQSLTVGVVSFIGRRDINPSGRPGYYDFIQTDASINPGNSGGPLLDREGRVVGISAAVNATGQGIGFAIPVNMAKDVLPALFEKGTVARSFLGIAIQDLSAELAESFGVASGVVVTEVTQPGPAAQAGFEVGDVITGIDGEPVTRAHRLRWLISSAGVGATARLRIVRGGRPRDLEVRLAPLPGGASKFERRGTPRARAELAPLGFAIGGPMVSSPNGEGCRVTQVDPAGEAYVAGLREGDVVLLVGDRSVRDAEQLARAIEGRPLVRLFIQRGLKPMFVAFRVRGQ